MLMPSIDESIRKIDNVICRHLDEIENNSRGAISQDIRAADKVRKSHYAQVLCQRQGNTCNCRKHSKSYRVCTNKQ